MNQLKIWAAAAVLLTLTSASQATLVNLGDGTVKDTVSNLIWLRNWNVNGTHNWATQMAWADNLAFAGSSDWVLPSINQYDTLFAHAGEAGFYSAFNNISGGYYWSRTEIAAGVSAFVFDSGFGLQECTNESTCLLSAVAVRPADVAVAVPEPQTLALALLALAAMAVARRTRG